MAGTPDPDFQPRGGDRRRREWFSAGNPRGRRWPQPQADRPRARPPFPPKGTRRPLRSLPGRGLTAVRGSGAGPPHGLRRLQRPQPPLLGGGRRAAALKLKLPPQGNRHLPLRCRFRVCKELRMRLPAGWAGPEPELSDSAMGAGPGLCRDRGREGAAGARGPPWVPHRLPQGQPFPVEFPRRCWGFGW